MILETYQLEKYKTAMSERIIEATWVIRTRWVQTSKKQ